MLIFVIFIIKSDSAFRGLTQFCFVENKCFVHFTVDHLQRVKSDKKFHPMIDEKISAFLRILPGPSFCCKISTSGGLITRCLQHYLVFLCSEWYCELSFTRKSRRSFTSLLDTLIYIVMVGYTLYDLKA